MGELPYIPVATPAPTGDGGSNGSTGNVADPRVFLLVAVNFAAGLVCSI